MNLDIFKEIKNNLSDINDIKEFINNLMQHLKTNNRNDLREEGCLYQVIDIGDDIVYLQNLNIDVVFEEKCLSKDIKKEINPDTILRYRNGEYIIEDKLTEEFFKNLVNIQEYKRIQDKFIRESDIKKYNPDKRYKVLLKKENYTIIHDINNNENTMEVPNELLPYHVHRNKVFYYENGKFKTDIEATKVEMQKT